MESWQIYVAEELGIALCSLASPLCPEHTSTPASETDGVADVVARQETESRQRKWTLGKPGSIARKCWVDDVHLVEPIGDARDEEQRQCDTQMSVWRVEEPLTRSCLESCTTQAEESEGKATGKRDHQPKKPIRVRKRRQGNKDHYGGEDDQRNRSSVLGQPLPADYTAESGIDTPGDQRAEGQVRDGGNAEGMHLSMPNNN